MAIGMTLLTFAAALAARFRRNRLPGLFLASGAAHGSDMPIPAPDKELKSQVSSINGEAESRQRIDATVETEAKPLTLRAAAALDRTRRCILAAPLAVPTAAFAADQQMRTSR